MSPLLLALPLQLVFVALGGGLGAAVRHLLVSLTQSWFGGLGATFPFGVLVANCVGSGLMGLLAGVLTFYASPDSFDSESSVWERLPLYTDHIRLFFGTGFLGGFTTFSAFSLDTLLLWRSGQMGVAALYVGASVCMCLVAVIFGYWIARQL